MSHIDKKKFQQAFLEEVSELLESLNENLLILENSPDDSDIINEIFRLTHSIKSESALVGFDKIADISHKMEDIFEKLRRNALVVNTEIMNHLLAAYDKIIEIIAAVQQNEDESGIDIKSVIDKLNLILSSDTKSVEKAAAPAVEKEQAPEFDGVARELEIDESPINEEIEVEFSDFEKGQIEDGLEKGESFYKISIHLHDDCEMRYPRAFLVYNNFVSTVTVVKTEPDILLEVEDEKFQDLHIYILSDLEIDELKKCADVDQVSKVEINKIELRALKHSGMDLSNVPGYTEMLISQEEIDEGERIEAEWEQMISRQKLAEKAGGGHEGFRSEEELTALVEKIKAQVEAGGDVDNIEFTSVSELAMETAKEEHKIHEPVKPVIRDKTIKKQTIRVDTDRLDMLMNLVGELIISHSRFLQIKNTIDESIPVHQIKSDLEDATNDLERISDMMQMGMMQVRMVPIATVFNKFPRMVRDLANSLHKNVNLMLMGETTEIDRAIIELITEPLTHLIRNAIDHAIELPDERERLSKSREGVIMLKAYQQGSSIYIEVNDDGRGMDIESIKRKGIERKLVTEQEAELLSPHDIINLIFEPGFSTKEEITGISGRGVGLDVVKTQIEKLRGKIDIETRQGRGTNITIILPLTLTIVEALLVNVGKSIFAIPVNVIEETLIINRNEIKDFDEYKVYSLRDETVAILYLTELVDLPVNEEKDEVFVVIVTFERRKVGLVVDELIGNQDIVIKALDESLKGLEGIAGATVLGDGKIGIILDVGSLIKLRKKEINRATDNYKFFGEEEKSINQFYDDINKGKEATAVIS